MLVILPPSETKVSGGGTGTSLDLGGLSHPALNTVRESLLGDLASMASDPDKALKALGLGPKGGPEVMRNLHVLSSPTMSALNRYTGVLYDALDYRGLSVSARQWVNKNVGVFSALFGLLGAEDLIPAYRLSWNSTLPSGKPQKAWATVQDAMWSEVNGFILDLRSEGYRGLAPVPSARGVFINFLKPGPSGSRVSLGHANKGTKGRFVHDLATSGASISSLDELVSWGLSEGYVFDARSHRDGRIDLVITDK